MQRLSTTLLVLSAGCFIAAGCASAHRPTDAIRESEPRLYFRSLHNERSDTWAAFELVNPKSSPIWIEGFSRHEPLARWEEQRGDGVWVEGSSFICANGVEPQLVPPRSSVWIREWVFPKDQEKVLRLGVRQLGEDAGLFSDGRDILWSTPLRLPAAPAPPPLYDGPVANPRAIVIARPTTRPATKPATPATQPATEPAAPATEPAALATRPAADAPMLITPEGKPALHAKYFFIHGEPVRVPDEALIWRRAGSEWANDNLIIVDKRGRDTSTLEEVDLPRSRAERETPLFAVHTSGFVLWKSEAIKATPIRLTPWSHLRGRVLTPTHARTEQYLQLQIQVSLPTGAPIVWFDTSVTTDADGRFEIERCPPGRARLFQTVIRFPKPTMSEQENVEARVFDIQESQSVFTSVGGTGDTITGQIEPDPRYVWTVASGSLTSADPAAKHPAQHDVIVKKDGTFLSTSTVPPGRYDLRIDLCGTVKGNPDVEVTGSARSIVTVAAPGPTGASDLGRLKVEVVQRGERKKSP